eukprot:s5629_g2.t1
MVIGVPWLFWVTILLCGVLYVCAIVLRSTVSGESMSLFGRCGSGDNYDFPLPGEPSTDGCTMAYLYLGEYCGTVFTCMFTVFRCLIGDCNSKGGRPLAAVLSDHYGWTFQGFYGLSMVTMIFGMTNIITELGLDVDEAMFVDATLSGLKYNDVQRKHAKLHETNYVTRKLNELVVRVSKTVREMRQADLFEDSQTNWRKSFKSFLRKGSAKISDSDLDRELTLSETEFTQVLQNSKIRNILDEIWLKADLDIELEARPGIFEAFGADADGHLGVSELVSGLMRLRGDLQKSDIVSAQMSLQTIGEKLNVFQATNLHNQSRLLNILDKLSKQASGILAELLANPASKQYRCTTTMATEKAPCVRSTRSPDSRQDSFPLLNDEAAACELNKGSMLSTDCKSQVRIKTFLPVHTDFASSIAEEENADRLSDQTQKCLMMHQQLQQLLLQQGSLPMRTWPNRTFAHHRSALSHRAVEVRMDVAPSARAARKAEALTDSRTALLKDACFVSEGEEPRQAVAECLGRKKAKLSIASLSKHTRAFLGNVFVIVCFFWRGAPLDLLKAEWLCSVAAQRRDELRSEIVAAEQELRAAEAEFRIEEARNDKFEQAVEAGGEAEMRRLEEKVDMLDYLCISESPSGVSLWVTSRTSADWSFDLFLLPWSARAARHLFVLHSAACHGCALEPSCRNSSDAAAVSLMRIFPPWWRNGIVACSSVKHSLHFA